MQKTQEIERQKAHDKLIEIGISESHINRYIKYHSYRQTRKAVLSAAIHMVRDKETGNGRFKPEVCVSEDYIESLLESQV